MSEEAKPCDDHLRRGLRQHPAAIPSGVVNHESRLEQRTDGRPCRLFVVERGPDPPARRGTGRNTASCRGAFRAHGRLPLVGTRRRQPLQRAARTSTWQYEALERIRTDLVPEEPHLAEWSAYDLAYMAHHEVGFFGYFAHALRRYICGDQEIRRKVADALKGAGADEKTSFMTPRRSCWLAARI